MSKEGKPENKNKGSKGKIWAALIILVLLIGGGVYYYLDLQQKKLNAVFEQLKQQGVVFKEWKKNSDKTYSLVEPKLQVADNLQFNVESINVAIKNDNLLDINLKNVTYKNDIVELALPSIAVTGYKMSAQVFDERLKDKMSPFALHLLSNDFKSMVFDSYLLKLAFSNEDWGIASEVHMKKYELLDFNNGVLATQNIDQFKVSLDFSVNDTQMTKITQNYSFERVEAKDGNLRLQMLMTFLSDDKPDQPFEKLSGPISYKNYKIEQYASNSLIQTQTVEDMEVDGIFMRYGKKSPFAVVGDWVVLAKAAKKADEASDEYKPNFPALFGLVKESLQLIEMVGPHKQVTKNISGRQQQYGFDIAMKVDEISVTYQPFNVSLQYKGIDVNALGPLGVDKPLFTAKIGIFGFENVNFFSFYNFGIEELDKLSKLENLPKDSNTYWLSFITNAGKVYPRIGRFEVKDVDVNVPIEDVMVKFDEISLTNKYALTGPIPTSMDLNIANYQQLVPDFKYLPQSFGLSDGVFKFSTRIKADYDEKQKKILLHDSFFENNVSGRMDVNATIGQVQPYLFSGNMIEMAAAATGLTVKVFKIDIDDKGKLKKIMEDAAADEGVSAKEVSYEMISTAVIALQGYIADENIRASVVAPLAKFINNGGIISIDAKSKTNFGVAMPSFAMIDLSNSLDPLWALFNITVSVK